MGNINSQISKIFQPSAAPSCLGNSLPRDLYCDDGSCSDVSPCNSLEIGVRVDDDEEGFVIVNKTDTYENYSVATGDAVFVSHGSYESITLL